MLENIDYATPEAMNSLLKLLEEPTPGIYAVLTCENKNRVLPTIQSRCQMIQFKAISQEALAQSLIQEGMKKEDANILSNVILQESDVLLNITGDSVARCCIVPNDVLPARVNQHVAIIRPNKDVDNTFICYQFTSDIYQQELLSIGKSNGATREALTKSQLESLTIILPPLALQQQFASKIEAIEKQKALIKKSIEEVETLFNSRMDYYFN